MEQHALCTDQMYQITAFVVITDFLGVLRCSLHIYCVL